MSTGNAKVIKELHIKKNIFIGNPQLDFYKIVARNFFFFKKLMYFSIICIAVLSKKL